MSFPLPSSYKDWVDVKSKLANLSKKPTFANLEKIILDLSNKTKFSNGRWISVEEDDPNLDEYESIDSLPCLKLVIAQTPGFLENILPKICELALQLELLFPDGNIPILRKRTNEKHEFNRKQIACLLSHMFFCSFVPNKDLKVTEKISGHFVGDRAPTGPITFRDWHSWRYDNGPGLAYLKTLFHYFEITFNESNENLVTEKVIFQRLTLDEMDLKISERTEQIVQVHVQADGRIGDKANHVEMDFANKNVGFGPGGTQEELILGMSPESTIVVLFNETLHESDAVVIQGAKRVGTYEGYGFDVNYTGPFTEKQDWSNRKILAMDAIPFPGSVAAQISDPVLFRELKKSLAAFDGVKGEPVESGHWGCGAFGGNPSIKALVQIMSASMAGLDSLTFYTFDDMVFSNNLKRCVHILKSKNYTVGKLWNLLKDFEREKETLGWSRFGQPSCKDDILVWINNYYKE